MDSEWGIFQWFLQLKIQINFKTPGFGRKNQLSKWEHLGHGTGHTILYELFFLILTIFSNWLSWLLGLEHIRIESQIWFISNVFIIKCWDTKCHGTAVGNFHTKYHVEPNRVRHWAQQILQVIRFYQGLFQCASSVPTVDSYHK